MPLVRAEVPNEAAAKVAYTARLLDNAETEVWGLLLERVCERLTPDQLAEQVRTQLNGSKPDDD